ncbi:unnamed protein product [Plutella xylostella]|uniref:(diamondback moth) hypothetical protein n=1 Tax=Plutella xylostella TaxID=51655 RepID=A0A8S4D2H6_PLUXY|nr:unnamed protein product [Plutella xylostella]
MARASVLVLCVFAIHFVTGQSGHAYEIPDVRVQVFQPKGLRMSIPDTPGIGLMAIQLNLNRKIASPIVGEYSGEVLSPVNGRWTYDLPYLELKMDDVINYYIFVSFNGKGYLKDDLTFKVTKFDNEMQETTLPSVQECRPSVTTVLGKPARCAGDTVFYDDFESLDTAYVWQTEHKIALDHPEYPFISYQRSAVEVQKGNLIIKPRLQQTEPSFNADSMYSGALNLNDWCTGPPMTCEMTASGVNVLPPVLSGRITNKNFTFRYGTVEIRAKVPQGDWLYPELLLVPFTHKYGVAPYASGLIKIATARGNLNLTSSSQDYGNKVLYGGPILERRCRDALQRTHALTTEEWGKDFHTYSLKWTPDLIVLKVDGTEWSRYSPSDKGMVGLLPESCQTSAVRYQAGNKMAPFDQEFTLSLGLAAGGVTEFPDLPQKPWRDSASKAKLHFWQALDSWYQTWGHNARLVVNYVKVTAV